MTLVARPHRPRLVLIDCERERQSRGVVELPAQPDARDMEDVDLDDLSSVQWPRLML